MPGKAGSSDGWTLTMRSGKRREEGGVEDRHVAGQHHELDAALLQPVGDRGVARGAVRVGGAREDARVGTPAPRARAPAPARPGWSEADGDDLGLAAVDRRRAAPGGSCPSPEASTPTLTRRCAAPTRASFG